MEVKRKFVIIISIFIIFFSSSCFAVTTLTDEQAEYVWEYLMGDTYDSELADNQRCFRNYGYDYNQPTPGYINHNWQAFKSYFNANNTLTIDPDTTFFAVAQTGYTDYILWVFNFNNSKPNGNNYPFMNLSFDTSANIIYLNAIDDNKNPVAYSSHLFIFNISSNNYVNFSNNWGGNYTANDRIRYRYSFNGWNSAYYNNTSVLQNIPRFMFIFEH